MVDEIIIKPADPAWRGRFEAEKAGLLSALGERLVAIEHIGSTAVPGLDAKPIIDIMVGTPRQHWPAVVEALKRLDYIHWEENPDTDTEFLVKGMPPYGSRRTHHVHSSTLACGTKQRYFARLLGQNAF